LSDATPRPEDAHGRSAAAPAWPERLVIASANLHKAAELRGLLAGLAPGVVLLQRPRWVPDVAETGRTLSDNARLKASALAAATGEAALADDTGLEVEALGGEPGMYAARYAGPGATYAENVAKLLGALEARGARSAAERRARFVTVALLRWPGGGEVVAEGVVEGWIAASPRGDDGFGYDPVFVPDEGGGRTFAEMTAAEKGRFSHRARALRSLAGAIA
jgi:XTP/dITP diphosphohydrolase